MFIIFFVVVSSWCAASDEYFDLPKTLVHSSQDLGTMRCFTCNNLPNRLRCFRIVENINKDYVCLTNTRNGLEFSLPHVNTRCALELHGWCRTSGREITVHLNVRLENNSPKGLVMHLFASPLSRLPRPSQTQACSPSDFCQYSAQKDTVSITRFIQEDKSGDRLFLTAQVDYDNLRTITVSYGVQDKPSLGYTPPPRTMQALTLAFTDICSDTQTISVAEKAFTSKMSVNFDAPEQPDLRK